MAPTPARNPPFRAPAMDSTGLQEKEVSCIDNPSCLPISLGAGAVFLLMKAPGMLLASIGGGFYLKDKVPSEASFRTFFEEWFYEDFWPQVSQKLQEELNRRSQSQGFLASMTTHLRSLVVRHTEGLHAGAWYEHIAHQALPPYFTNYANTILTATVNVGTLSTPCMVTFWGANHGWFLPPWKSSLSSLDVSSFLD
eukprot:TRINITY_DN10304_c0_g1_i5.p1 TRINITY_DN10304_c0_g1~~TRINITY_DN10304_c0_g1_i5.p1  ORF type:complete len:214 (-),score=17.09 TRINITY_DN10304_c0_g1_i5:183-770(-)